VPVEHGRDDRLAIGRLPDEVVVLILLARHARVRGACKRGGRQARGRGPSAAAQQRSEGSGVSEPLRLLAGRGGTTTRGGRTCYQHVVYGLRGGRRVYSVQRSLGRGSWDACGGSQMADTGMAPMK
jgi:hypothetical protein